MIKKLQRRHNSEKNFLLAWLTFAFLLRLAYVIKTGTQGISPDALNWAETAWSSRLPHPVRY